MSTHPGESAFTRPSSENDWGKDPGAPGLTKREYFAACAMQGIVSNGIPGLKAPGKELEVLSFVAVQFADALIAALNEVKP